MYTIFIEMSVARILSTFRLLSTFDIAVRHCNETKRVYAWALNLDHDNVGPDKFFVGTGKSFFKKWFACKKFLVYSGLWNT